MRKLAVALCLFVMSCACGGERANTWICIAKRKVIDCTAAEVQPLVQNILPLVVHLLDGAGGDPKWEEYLAGLEAIGINIVACAVQTAVDNEVAVARNLPDPGSAPEADGALRSRFRTHAEQVQARAEMWKVHRLPPGTVVKTAK